MGIFNNTSEILSGVGGQLLGGAVNKIQSNMTADAEEAEWYNVTGWFGSLIDAQKYSNSVIMGANRERIPMIIEYMTGPVGEEQHSQYGYEYYRCERAYKSRIGICFGNTRSSPPTKNHRISCKPSPETQPAERE